MMIATHHTGIDRHFPAFFWKNLKSIHKFQSPNGVNSWFISVPARQQFWMLFKLKGYSGVDMSCKGFSQLETLRTHINVRLRGIVEHCDGSHIIGDGD